MSYTVKYTWLHPDQTPRSEHGRVPICEREWSQLEPRYQLAVYCYYYYYYHYYYWSRGSSAPFWIVHHHHLNAAYGGLTPDLHSSDAL